LTRIRTVPAHEIVRRTFPRPPPEERDQVAMAVGKAIDGVLSDLGHQLGQGRRPTQAATGRLAVALLDDALAENAVRLEPVDRAATLAEIEEVVRAYRRSEIAGLARPRTRVFLVGEAVGVYAQPDYWDRRRRFFEMKSYRAIPPPPDVALQLDLFQLAYPGFEAVLVCLDRHRRPVEVTSAVLPALTPARSAAALRLAYDVGSAFGEEKVLEYVEGPVVRYALPPAGP
jgi:hypothetical protein